VGGRVIFYLGTDRPNWLGRVDLPLFVSHRTLVGRRTLPRSRAPWALDSGAFSELSRRGEWQTTPTEYVQAVRRYADEIGHLAWAAPQDWMCEPFILAKTGLTVAEHQARTVANFLELRDLAPDLPFVPVLQGWAQSDYLRHADAYDAAGVDLGAERTVGLGSVCRRQNTGQIAAIVSALAGLRLHGFGVKTSGLAKYSGYLASGDSMAWCYRGWRAGPCVHGSQAKTESHCLEFALAWRDRVLAVIAAPTQLDLFAVEGGAAA
jgi:hypothetical protein